MLAANHLHSPDPVSPLFATLTKCPQIIVNTTPFLATHTGIASVSPVFATHTKTTGVYTNSSHFGTRLQPLSADLLSHPISHRALHPIKEEEPAEQDERDSSGGSQEKQAGSVAAAGDGPAKTVNDAGHGIEAVEPAPARGNQRGRVGDRRSEHPELHEERNDVAHVAVERVKRGKPQADAESGEEREEEQRGKPERGQRGTNAVSERENGQDHEADGEVYEAGERSGNGKNEAREIYFGDEALI